MPCTTDHETITNGLQSDFARYKVSTLWAILRDFALRCHWRPILGHVRFAEKVKMMADTGRLSQRGCERGV